MDHFHLYEGHHYRDWPWIEAWCHEMVRRYPHWLRLETYGISREGRPLLILTLHLGEGDPRERSAFWLDGGTHASEWAGVMSCLYTLSRWLEALERGNEEVTRWFGRHTAYVVPCLSPDGFQHMMSGGAFVRSTLRPPLEGSHRIGLEVVDLNGDGEILTMRWPHPAGPWVQDEELPMLLRPRQLTDPPEKAYFCCREGVFLQPDESGWVMAPALHALDLNRNFSVNWTPFHQFGMDGGEFALSEPEALAATRALHDRPNVCGVITNHTYTGGILTAPYRPDSVLSGWDRETLYRLATEVVAETPYRVFRAYPEFVYEEGKSMPGVWADYLTSNRGIPAYTLELWDPYRYGGVELKDPAKSFFRPEPGPIRQMVRRFAEDPANWVPWKPYDHPQLGPVEIGGLRDMVTVRNPPLSELPAELERAYVTHDTMRRALPEPALRLRVEKVEGDVHILTAEIENRGYLRTSGLALGETAGFSPRPVVEIELAEPLERLTGAPRTTLPHLAGWGDAPSSFRRHPLYPVLANENFAGKLSWTLKGSGRVKVSYRHPRSGSLSVEIDIT